MTDLYNWTDNPTEVGVAEANPDTLNECLMHLKYDNSGGVSKFDIKGPVTEDITLAENKITTGHWSGDTNTITLPDVTGESKQVVCILDFTTATAGKPSITNSNVIWSEKTKGIAPSAYSTASGVRNIIVAKSIWVSGSLYWEVEYSTCGGVEVAFSQPVLSSNGTLGGTSFAVACAEAQGSYPAYYAVDGNNNTATQGGSGVYPVNFIIYNPDALKINYINVTNQIIGSYVYSIRDYAIYGSNDNSTYAYIMSGQNTNNSQNYTWQMPVNSPSYYKYYKIAMLSTNYGAAVGSVGNFSINATYIQV